MELLRELNAAGTTIVQVTHRKTMRNTESAWIRLRDGWIVD
jgi:ABC-type ATPase involved in cell division